MKASILSLWLVANAIFFAINFFVFQVLNKKLWRKIISEKGIDRNIFFLVIGNFSVSVCMYFSLLSSASRAIDLAGKNQITHSQLIQFLALCIGFSILWGAISDRFSKIFFQSVTKRNELIETFAESNYMLAIRMLIYFTTSLIFSPIVEVIIESLIPQIQLPFLIR
jgi:hypothetical protein